MNVKTGSIGRRAAVRLLVSLGLLVALIAVTSIGIYQAALRQAVHQRAGELADFYANRLNQLEREWDIRSRDFKVRIEITRELERPASAQLNLQAFMTIQGADRPFDYVLIQGPDGRKLFDFGEDMDLPAIPTGVGETAGHYKDPASGRVYRVFRYPIWLGEARGMGRFATFVAIDNALLRQLLTPGVVLTALYEGEPFASSEGNAALARYRQAGRPMEAGRETRRLSWTGAASDALQLHIEAPIMTLFSTSELTVAMSIIPIIDGLVLWLTLGLWLMRQTRRITDLGGAVEEYASAGQATSSVRERLANAEAGHADEISQVAAAVGALAADIDRREQEREGTLSLLRASDKEYRTILRTTADGFWIVSAADGRLLDFNSAACAMLGYSREELLAMRISEFEAAETPQETRRHIADIMAGQRERFESLHRRKDGRIIDVEISCRYVDVRGGALVVFVRDISERKRAEAALKAAKAEAVRANHTKSAFLANMSHEIRTPLHVITGLGHLLRRDAADLPQMERLDQLCATSEHLLAIVNNVLDLTKIEAGQLALDRSDFRLETVVERVVRMIEGQAHEKGLMLATEVAQPLRDTALSGDPVRLAQVLINLCSNAVKFTDEGAVRLRIGFVAESRSSVALCFSVEDTGIGIPPADVPRLFQPFTQADDSSTRERGGTGLGLAISQRLVGLMGGAIEVDSQPGAGSRFSFELELPRATADVAQPAAAPVSGMVRFQGSNVLFAEDHPLSQEILFEMLEDLGCDVEVASDGAEAVECVRERGYDLILMDMQMPRMDGLAATRAIRGLPQGRDTPIIALTANAFADDRQRCLDAGMNGHLGKPVTPATLAAALSRWLPHLVVPGDEEPLCENDLTRALAKIPGLEVGRAWRRSAEHVANYCMQLDRFAQTHAGDMARLRLLLAAGKLHDAHVLAHNLKGIAGLVSASRVASLAGDLVRELRAGADAARLASLVDACETELASLAERVRALPQQPGETAEFRPDAATPV